MKKNILFLFLPLLFAFNLHKIHVSLTKIVYKKESKILQITTRFFIDDIENALNKKYQQNIELNTDRETNNADLLIKEYLLENLKIKLDDTEIKLQFLGKEYEDDIVYIYFEMKNIPNFKIIEVLNTSLFELFEDQQNIIKIKYNNIQKTMFLKPNHFKEILTIP